MSAADASGLPPYQPAIEATILFDREADTWIGGIDSPDGSAERRCARPAPILEWMRSWSAVRNVPVTVTVWFSATDKVPS